METHYTPLPAPDGGSPHPSKLLFCPQFPHLRARVSQARGRCVTASDRPPEKPRDSNRLSPPQTPLGGVLWDTPNHGFYRTSTPGRKREALSRIT